MVRREQARRDPGQALSWLVDLAEGHPQRAMLLAHLLWSTVEPAATAGEDAVRSLGGKRPPVAIAPGDQHDFGAPVVFPST